MDIQIHIVTASARTCTSKPLRVCKFDPELLPTSSFGNTLFIKCRPLKVRVSSRTEFTFHELNWDRTKERTTHVVDFGRYSVRSRLPAATCRLVRPRGLKKSSGADAFAKELR